MTVELKEPTPPPAPPPPPAPIPKGWEGLLAPGEVILWQGKPSPEVRFQLAHLFPLIFGLFFAGFALFWMIMAAQAGGVFWAFGLLHFGVGLSVALSGPFGGPYRRRYTYYTLTNRRAFVATDLPVVGRKLQEYPISGSTPLTFEEVTDQLSNVYFAKRTSRGKSGMTHNRPIGFEMIHEGRKVLGLMRGLQREEEA